MAYVFLTVLWQACGQRLAAGGHVRVENNVHMKQHEGLKSHLGAEAGSAEEEV